MEKISAGSIISNCFCLFRFYRPTIILGHLIRQVNDAVTNPSKTLQGNRTESDDGQ